MKTYKAMMTNGATITIADVTSVAVSGNGTRFLDEDGSVIANFSDGQIKGHWPADAIVEKPGTEQAE